MPSSAPPLEYTRSFTFHVEHSPRYGNFQKLDNLPAVGKNARAGEHYIPYFTNQNIFKTVSSWVESWQSWQQRVLLCGIADRLPLRQIDVLATTLEPVCHRDYITACRQQYPSTPFKSGRVNQDESEELYAFDDASHLQSQIVQSSALENTSSNAQSPRQKVMRSTESLVLPPIPLLKETQDRTDGSREITPSVSPLSAALHEFAKAKANSIIESVLQSIATEQHSSLGIDGEYIEVKPLTCTPRETEVISETESKPENGAICDQSQKVSTQRTDFERSQNVCVDLFHNSVKSTPTKTPNKVNHSPIVVNYEGQKDTQSEVSPSASPLDQVESNENLFEKEIVDNVSKTIMSPHPDSIKDDNAFSLKLPHYGLSHSVDYIDDQQTQTPVESPSLSYSPFKHHLGYFHVNTPDFFSLRSDRRLGPLQTSLELQQDRLCQSDSNIPLHLTYKNAKWWRETPRSGQMYLRARKKELLPHYKKQLQQIWEWLEMWTDFERVAFVKEIIKVSETDVLTAFASYVQQRLRDAWDINRLPDELLLQIFSNLNPSDISSASQVSRRWRYLCDSDNLWMMKCHQMGEKEGFGNVNDLVMRVSGGRLGVDWKNAYRELEKIARNIKMGIGPLSKRKAEGCFEEVTDENENMVLQQENSDITDDNPDEVIPKTVELRVKVGTESQLFGDRYQGSVAQDSDSDVSEDLIPLMTDYHYYSADALKAKKRWSNRRGGMKKIPQNLAISKDRGDAFDGQPLAERPRLLETLPTEEKKIEDEDLAYDIRPHLKHNKDLLGKLSCSHTLKWEAPSKQQDQKPPQLDFAGQITGIKKVKKLQGHSGGVLCVHSDQRRLASGGWDRIIRLWDVRSGRSLHKFFGHRGGIHSLLFDNDIMVSGSWDMTIMVWCMKKFTRRLIIHDHKGCVSCLALHKDYIVSGSHDTTVRVFYRNTLLPYTVITGHTRAVNCLSFDGERVLSGSADRTLRLTNIHTLQLLQVFEGMQEAVLSLLSQGSLLIGGDSLGRIYFWNKSTGESEAAIQAHDGPVNSIGFLGSRLLTASGDCTIKEWDISTMTTVRCLDGHKGAINHMAVTEKRIVSCSEDGNIRIWDIFSPNKGKKKKTLKSRSQRRNMDS